MIVLAKVREVASANWLTYFESYPGEPVRSVPVGTCAGRVQPVKPARQGHVTVSSQPQQQPFTLSSRASDVNFPKSVGLIAAISPGYPFQSSYMEGPGWDQPKYCNQLYRFLPPNFFCRRKPLCGDRRREVQLRLREFHFRFITAASHQERYVRLEPQGLTPIIATRSSRCDIWAI